MADISNVEQIVIEDLFEMETGYVLDFSNRTFRNFILGSVQIDIYDEKYNYQSGSKANRLRRFLKEESNQVVGKLLSDLLDYWELSRQSTDPVSESDHHKYEQIQQLIAQLRESQAEDTLSIYNNNSDEIPTLDTSRVTNSESDSTSIIQDETDIAEVTSHTSTSNYEYSKSPRWYQKLISSYIPYLIAGFFFIGSALDTYSNAIGLITPRITYIGSILLLLAIVIAYVYLRLFNLSWIDDEGNEKTLQTLEVKPLLLLLGVFVALWFPRLFESSEPIQTSELNQSQPIVIEQGEPELEVINQRTITQNNCGGSLDVESIIERSRTIQHVLTLPDGFVVGEDGTTLIDDTTVKLGEAIAEQLGYEYGTVEQVSRSLVVRAEPQSNMLYEFAESNVWETGQATITIMDEEITLPFRFQTDFAIELVRISETDCDVPASNEQNIEESSESTINTEQNLEELVELLYGERYTNYLTKETWVDYIIAGTQNSPLLVEVLSNSGNLNFQIAIYDENGFLVTQTFPQLTGRYETAFTPKINGSYVLRITSTIGEGEIFVQAEKLNPVGFADNEVVNLDENPRVSRSLALGAFHDYTFAGNANEPIALTITKETSLQFVVMVFDPDNVQVTETPPQENNIAVYSVTPAQDGIFTVSIAGVDGHGEYSIRFDQ